MIKKDQTLRFRATKEQKEAILKNAKLQGYENASKFILKTLLENCFHLE